ncbi:hypothetical protein KFL_001000290 [Klebsormidium nitens]|uniref:3'-5' exonuclease domain-containing protein n=1 Tax=Klebsormidium nitens TaxID=105231 RepID=A0A1Y1HZZ9_KLENI|nr:hypothetical protein KFL_001000290 [Klebsormidium nitens]|eukprot:GAQ82107.1 hypothetical protein KFL_001000290 [Klebsormidium nitens]
MKRKRPSKRQKAAAGAQAEEHGAGASQHHRVATVVKQYCILENDVEVTLTNEAMRVEQWVSAHMAESFGLDVEWKPTFKRGARENPVALLQLSTLRHCLLIQMQRMATIPEGLRRLLAAPEVALSGVGVREDLRKLARDYGLECDGAVELAVLAGEVLGRPELRQAGLRALSMAVLRKDWVKNKRVTMSNWEQDLDQKQVTYAATDAWVSHAVHQALQRHRGGRGEGAAELSVGGTRRTRKGGEGKVKVVGGEDGALELEFAREVERRQIDVNPHGAFLRERRRLSGQDKSPQGRGAEVEDLCDKLPQKGQGEAVGDLRVVLTDRKRTGTSAEA